MGYRFSGGLGGRGNKTPLFTDEQLLSELRTVSNQLGGKLVTIDLFNQYADINPETIRRRFGSWWAALKKAGLPISNLGKRYSDNDYFENLLSVWTHYGRQPLYREMDESPSSIPSGAYEAKWGAWTKALIAFLERVNSDSQQDEAKTDPVAEKPKARTALRRRPFAPAKEG